MITYLLLLTKLGPAGGSSSGATVAFTTRLLDVAELETAFESEE